MKKSFRNRIIWSLLVLACLASPWDSGKAQSRYLIVYPAQPRVSGSIGSMRSLYVSSVSADGSVGWPAEEPRQIANAEGHESEPVAVGDGEGGAFVAYTIDQGDSTAPDRDILMRHLDRDGRDLWAEPVTVARSKFVEEHPQLVAASDGSLIVSYEVRYTGAAAGDVDVAATKIGRDGTKLWKGAVWLSNSKRRELLASTLSDSHGGVIAILETAISTDSTSGDIYAAHIDSAGTAGWSSSREPVAVAASRHMERHPAAVEDGKGGVFVAYELQYVGTRSNDADILAQHVLADGKREWVNESSLPVVSSVSKAVETFPAISRDGDGIIVAFQMNIRDAKKQYRLIGLQRMDSAGKRTWNHGKKPVVATVEGRALEMPQLIADTNGGAFLLAQARDTAKGDVDIFAESYNEDGEASWSKSERPVPVFTSPAKETNPSAIPDGNGGIIVVAAKEFTADSVVVSRNIVGIRLNQQGKPAWVTVSGPLLITNSTFEADRPRIIGIP